MLLSLLSSVALKFADNPMRDTVTSLTFHSVLFSEMWNTQSARKMSSERGMFSPNKFSWRALVCRMYLFHVVHRAGISSYIKRNPSFPHARPSFRLILENFISTKDNDKGRAERKRWLCLWRTAKKSLNCFTNHNKARLYSHHQPLTTMCHACRCKDRPVEQQRPLQRGIMVRPIIYGAACVAVGMSRLSRPSMTGKLEEH